MRTALVLLLLLGAASVAGSLVPQRGLGDARIRQMFRENPLRAEWFERLGLFDVFGSWWFTLIYALLLVSLAACLIPRTRALVRGAFARPQLVRELDGFRHYAERALPATPGEALAHARRSLRRRRFRVRGPDGGMVAAEKGVAREAGSLLFHWSFFLILLGAIYGKGTGFTGTAVITEGETWVETHASYDGQIQEGRFFREAHSGIAVRVRDFTVDYRRDGSPAEFTTRADLLDPEGRLIRTVDIQVNHPASAGGVKLYQAGFGWAPVVRVERDGEAVASSPIVFVQSNAPGDVDPRTLPWRGVLKLPSLEPQVGLELLLWPDARGLAATLGTGEPFAMLESFRPVIAYTAYRGDLRLSTAQGAFDLDTGGMRRFDQGVVGEGQSVELPGGIELSFPELREYTVLQVSRDRGTPIMLVAAVLILVGLLPALYGFRRKIWVSAETDGAGTVLRVGGFALQRKDRFEEEFARLVDDLAGATPGKREEVRVT